jgi:hypothetical protein
MIHSDKRRRLIDGIKILGVLALLTGAAAAAGDESDGAQAEWPTAELHFFRLHYSDSPAWGGYRFGDRYGHWTVDTPAAEYHFTHNIPRLTRIDVGTEERRFRLSNDAIFNYPFMYAVEVGHWYLDDEEAVRLREYLLRGGFLMVDDFHGPDEWQVFMESMTRVFPDRPVVDIPESDPIFHAVYDLDKSVQIPGIRPLTMGVTYEYGGKVPHWRGVYDDNGRLMVLIGHNMDLGDSWELADDPYYPEHYTTLGFRFAVNYLIYAMTH